MPSSIFQIPEFSSQKLSMGKAYQKACQENLSFTAKKSLARSLPKQKSRNHERWKQQRERKKQLFHVFHVQNVKPTSKWHERGGEKKPHILIHILSKKWFFSPMTIKQYKRKIFLSPSLHSSDMMMKKAFERRKTSQVLFRWNIFPFERKSERREKKFNLCRQFML